MNMKKVLAVVLAVMLAISAMAVTAFASEKVIELSNSKAYDTTKPVATNVNFTVPVYAKYGYATDFLEVTFTLPENGKYAVVVDNISYALGEFVPANGEPTAPEGLAFYKVTFGTLAHSWDGTDTVIPQSTIVGDKGVLNLVATFDIAWNDGTVDASKKDKESFRLGASSFNRTKKADEIKAADGTVMPNYAVKGAIISDIMATVVNTYTDDVYGASYCFDWNPTDGADSKDGKTGTNAAALKGLKWDATLANKAAILSAETAKVVVKLNTAIAGDYYFALAAKYGNNTYYDGGHNITWDPNAAANKYADIIETVEVTDTITFEIPTSVLYTVDGYGIFNEQFDITIYNTIDSTAIEAIKGFRATSENGTFGRYSWDKNDIYYNGVKVTAKDADGIAALVTDVDLVLTVADEVEETPDTEVVPDVDDTVDVEAPVESTEEETEDVEAPAEEEKNPETGVAFALVPAVIALAVVAFKKR